MIRGRALEIVVACLGLVLPAESYGERYKLVIDERTFEGDLLNLIDAERGAEKRLPLLDRFLAEYPRHVAVPWILEHKQAALTSLGRHADALAAGEKLFALNPTDLSAAFDNANAARLAGDSSSAARWSATALALAAKYRSGQIPKADGWDEQMSLANQLADQGDYEIYTRMRATNDPRQIVAAGKELFAKFPQSRYAAEGRLLLMNAQRTSGDLRGAAETAELILAADPNQPDALFTASHAYLQLNTHASKAAEYAGRLLAAVKNLDTPGGIYYRGMSHWIIGTLEIRRNRFKEADAYLRAAERDLTDRAEAQAPLTFYLGWANYNLQRLADAERYFERCSRLESPYRTEAINNLSVVRREKAERN